MRFGKRSLAAVAAGALGAALIPFVAASPASAGAAATVAFTVPSVTVIGSNFTEATGTTGAAIPVPVVLLDAAGDPVASADDTTGLSVELSITAPNTALVDDSLSVAFTTGTGTTIKKASSTYTASGLLGATISPNGVAGTSWDSVARSANVGTYTLTARLFATGSGAVVSTTSIPFTISNNAAAPAPSVSFANTDNVATANVINALGATTGDSVGDPSGKFHVYLTNSTGGPYYIIDDSVAVSATNTAGSVTYGLPAGGLSSSAPNAIYSFTTVGGQWGTAATATVTATVTPGATATTGTLPVGVGAANALTSAPTVRLTTAGYQPNPAQNVYQVPPGTSSLTFSVATANGLTTSSLGYNVTSSVDIVDGGGVVTPSGGAAAISADAGTVTVNVNAAASANGGKIVLTIGDYVTGSRTTQVTVDFVAPTATVIAAAPITQVATASTISGTVLTQYGAALPGTWAITAKAGTGANCSATTIASATAAADGSFSLTIPASFAATSAGTRGFTLCASNGFTQPTTAPVTITYTASGGLNSLTMAVTTPSLTSASIPVIQVPASGVANLTNDTTNSVAASQASTANVNAAGTGTAFQLTVTSNPAATVTLSGPTGVFFTTATTGSLVASAGRNPLTTTTTGSPAARIVSVYATKPGTHTVTVTAGTSTATISFVAGVAIGSGRTLTATPAAIDLAPNEFKAASVTLVDLYGNPVPDDTGITVALAGGGTLSSTSTITNASGVATVFYTAPLGTGTGQLLWSMAAGRYISGNITGFPAAVNTATTIINVRTGSTKSIVIVGERGTVGGKPGILVEGSTTGFDVGSKMVPSVRFPGQTEFTAGTARPTTSASGDFSWQRKTGKKTTVFFSNEAGDVKSNRVIIPAN